jgi:tetratricopeptide (TPR) repeat protein
VKRKTSETKRKVTSRAASLPKQLTTLESADLVRLAQRKPALEYLFRHALIQDAAYQSLLKADRRTLHQLVGETLEQLYPKRLGELAPLLAQHFVAAGDDERALKYFTQAGDEAMRVYANAEAILHYTHALNLAKAASFAVEPSQGSTLQHLYMQCGRALELSGRYAEALQNYVEMETLAQARSDGALELAAVMARGTIYATATTKFDAPQAQALCERALQLARSLGDAAAEAKILWNVSNLHGFSGDPAQAILYGEQAVAVARAHGLREQMAFALHDIWRDYLVTGQLARGHEAVREVSALWRELDNRPMLTDSLATASG